jgi:fumarate hydratase subunit alpha
MGKDVLGRLAACADTEKSPIGVSILGQIVENDTIASEEKIAICQDTGMAILFVELGQDVHIVGGGFEEALQAGVREAYTTGYLRKSIVTDPLFDRINTKDNTPAVIHVSIVPGDRVRILATPKGFGSENMSAVAMLTPGAGVKGVKDFVVETVIKAGPNPCPPIIIGIGIGGTLEKAALIAKKATVRELGMANPDPRYAKLEEELRALVNATGIGPGGLGGTTTALAVHIEHFPTHIAGMPLAVNICCHAARHAEALI